MNGWIDCRITERCLVLRNVFMFVVKFGYVKPIVSVMLDYS